MQQDLLCRALTVLQQEREHEQIDRLDPNEILQQEREQINRWAPHIIPGTYFSTPDGQMASVVQVRGNSVFAVLDGEENEVIYDINEAAMMLQRYIG